VTRTGPTFDDLLTIKTRAELRGAFARFGAPLSLPQVQRLAAHAESLGQPEHSLRVGIVHTYTSDLLDPWLSLSAALEGMALHVYHAPYGLSVREAQSDSSLVAHAPDLTLFLLRREDLHPALARPLAALDPVQQESIRREALGRLGGIIRQFRAQRIGQIVLTLLPSVAPAGLGIYDAQSDRSETGWWAALKVEIGQWLRESVPASLLLDLDEVLQHVGREGFFDLRYWYSARFPFRAAAAREVARRVIAIGALLKFPRAKVIVLDADNTLWGGIVGEDGLHGIALGPEYPGNAFMDFQRRILDYQQRGFILALCSKNNAADVEQVLTEHPHQLLRDEHFAARRVNWLPKPDNLISLAEELNLGLESFIFVDDSEHECAGVRHRLPQVEVIQTPAKPVDVPGCLEHVARLEVLSLTAEDLAKTEMYAQERRRRESWQRAESNRTSQRDYLASLEMKMRIGFNDARQVARLSQMTQKTNQFNLTTRKYDEQQMHELIGSEEWLVAHFSLSDVFGDNGIVGLALVRLAGERAEVDTFLMSCRVIGRDAEAAFMQAVLRRLAEGGMDEVVADYRPTAKNGLVKDFLPEQGFARSPDGRFRRWLRTDPPLPESAFLIAVETAGQMTPTR
jgi:FkbH-like protein